MRTTWLLFSLAIAGCDGKAPPPARTTPIDANVAATPLASSAPRATASARPMPERPVPTTDPTVTASMPADVQLKAIGYMNAMKQPHDDDANADAAYASTIATQLTPILKSMDNGSADEKARLNRVEVIGAGREIDLLMASGCSAETPFRAFVQRAGVPLSTLLSRGVLVVRCNDARAQCLQSTRDQNDVLCTTAPRHK